MQGQLHVLNPETGELEPVSASAALADFGLSGMDGDGRTVMRVVALSTAAVGQCRLTPGSPQNDHRLTRLGFRA